MKIAMLAFGGGSGGLVRYIQELLAVPAQHEINVFCSEKLNLGNLADNVIVTRTDYARERGVEILLDKPLHPELIKMVNAYNPDVVFFSNGWERRGLEQYPNIMVLHNALYVDDAALRVMLTPKKFLTFMGFRHIVRRSIKRADGVIFLRDKSKEDTDRIGLKYKSGKVIYFGMPKYNFSTERPALDKENIKLLYVSPFHKYKCHETLINGMKLLVDKGYSLSLELIGGIPEAREQVIREMVARLGMAERVQFSGWCTHEEVMQAMKRADIFVYPTRIEAAGLGVMEPMAQSMPIASSNTACMPEILKDAGTYFNPFKPQELADAVEKLIVDDAFRETCSKKAYAYASEYSWERAMREHMEYFEAFKNN